jgi:uncharacterized Fe-S center protein
MSETSQKKSKVYFADLRARTPRENRTAKIKKLFNAAGFAKIVAQGGLTAVKLHFGERGCDTHVSPVLVRAVVDKILEHGGRPFLTDTNTLYSGSRHNGADHLLTALSHGFGFEVTGAPILIADGLSSTNVAEVAINRKHFERVKIAGDIAAAQSMLVISHFKGHEMAGFGGAVKNLAMGCAPRVGKQEQHCVRFRVDGKKCVGCAACSKVCPQDAVSMSEKTAHIDPQKCIGCGECLTVCQEKAVGLDFRTDLSEFMERMVEYAYGAVKNKRNRVGFINILTNVTPDCDCVPWSDAPLVPDIGFLASTDPVALDAACFDLVNAQTACCGTHLTSCSGPGENKFAGCWPETRGEITFVHGEAVGLGRRAYELIPLTERSSTPHPAHARGSHDIKKQ